ncbi:MAG TPA: hypothetical protein VIM65_22205 [Cyclobacteriaceae bacterium]
MQVFDFLRYYLILILALSVFIFFGYGILRIFRIHVNLKSHSSIFASGVVGALLLVSIGACFFTGFKTVFIAVPVILLATVFSLEKHFKNSLTDLDSAKWVNIIFEFFIVSLFIYTFNYYLLFYDKSLLATPHPDIIFHSKLSVYLQRFGIESSELEYYYQNTIKPQPYHYVEAWTTSLLDFFLNQNNVLLLSLVVFPCFLVILFFGYSAILHCITGDKSNWLSKCLCLISIPLTGLAFKFYSDIPFLSSLPVFARNPINYSKLSVIYLSVISAVLLVFKGAERAALRSLLILPIVFISCAPSVLMGVCLVHLWNLFQHRKVLTFLEEIFFVGVVCAVMLWVYYPSNHLTNEQNSVVRVGGSLGFFDFQYFKTCINVCGGTTIQLIILYLPILLIAFFAKVYLRIWNESSSLIKVGFLISISGLLFWAALHRMPDSIQLFSNFSICFFNILSFIIIIYAYKHYNSDVKKLLLSFFVGVVILLSIVNTVSEMRTEETPLQVSQQNDFYKKLRAHFTVDNPIGVYIRNKDEYTSVFVKNSNFATLANFLLLLDDRCHQISISVFDIKLDESSPLFQYESSVVKTSTFHRYVMEQKRAKSFISIEQSQLDFINTLHVQYLVASDRANVPQLILNSVKEEFVEPVTKVRILLLK